MMSSYKAEFRKVGLMRRASVSATERAGFAARLAAVGPELVAAFPVDGRPPVVSLFSPINSEPDVGPLAEALMAGGATLVLPVDWSSGTPLLFRGWRPGDRLAAGPLGIAEPLEGAAEHEPDIVFFPAVAFDRRGHRIGYGAGNVDRSLAALRARKPIRVIGIAYAVQEVAEIPNEPHDQAFDQVVTDRDIFDCSP
ncbi:5-formyltetrahydrofolate cyclo-ligase [Lichenihabitans sp. Uapishka_5]|uniref:5-formyltetrahydrofolate cyclo-ligase n=1 Tax=Lichenihabitans sp. Uapishka_5 TaxID=3037302 RepID=UPI0029E816D6|nr:5-formyltetrahydrofolate cyclo-ligase [Lichenihabitans sp. Uapishka_5]MDX7953319.1 5-formyltetrahydrofolate cyclo-ligase [Lichenihabitans sp. Uapishka_5]